MSVTVYGHQQYVETGRVLDNGIGGELIEYGSLFNPNLIYSPRATGSIADDPGEPLPWWAVTPDPVWPWQPPIDIGLPPVAEIPCNPVHPPANPGADIPEPATAVLLMAAMVLMAIVRKFRSAESSTRG